MPQHPNKPEAPPNTDQSVLISSQELKEDVVKLYPRDLSNDEIDYDVQMMVLKKPEEQYHLEFTPTRILNKNLDLMISGGISKAMMGTMIDGYKELKAQEEENIVLAS